MHYDFHLVDEPRRKRRLTSSQMSRRYLATVIINRTTGAGPTKTPITATNTRCNAADAPYTVEVTNPIAIPGSGSNYSYWCSTRLDCTVAPVTALSNISWYSDGSDSFGTNVTCVGNTATGYVQATGTPGTTGTVLSTGNYATLAGAPTNVFAMTAGSPLSITGSIGVATGDFGDFFVFQIVVGTTASPGATPQETFTWIIDES